jgi:PhnB protein
MASTSSYLNFNGTTEAAFTFYKAAFGTEFVGPITRHGDVPPHEGQTELSDEMKQMVMNVQLPITGGHLLMGTDVTPEMGFTVVQGNNFSICVQPDSRAEADALFSALSEGGRIDMPMAEMFWGDYFGSFADRFGVQWMVTTPAKA